jgi:hypothetical protein
MFDKFGKISYVPNSKVARFVECLEEGKLTGTKCKKCGTLYVPPKADCVDCLSDEMEWVELSGECTLHTFTTIHAAPAGFDDFAPYTLAVVDMKEGGRLMTFTEGLSEEDLEIGMDLRVVPKEMDGKLLYVVTRP